MKSELKKRNYQLSSKDEWTNEEEDKEPPARIHMWSSNSESILFNQREMSVILF